jgi:asparagine synthase (glutamine-hydrolysing)
LHNELKPLLLQYLDYARIQREGILNPDEVVRLRDQFLRKSSVNPHNIWLLLLFELWYERWMK